MNHPPCATADILRSYRLPEAPDEPKIYSSSGRWEIEEEQANASPVTVAVSGWPEPAAEIAFHGLAGDLVRLIEEHTEADPIALLGQFLVAFGNAIGRAAHFIAEADRHYTNLFVALVGRTAKGRKGSSLGQILGPLSTVDPDWAKWAIQGGLASGEGLIWAVRDPIEKTQPVKEKGRIKSYETVIVDEGVSDKRLLVVESEFASVIKVIAREGNILSAVIRQAWDSGSLRVMTKNSPAKSTDAHISIIGHITRDELLRYLHATETANGFANRFLWLCVRRSKMLPDGGQMESVDFGPFISRLRETISFASQVGHMKRDEEARQFWCSVYPDLSEGQPGLLGAVTSRAEAQVMRLACLYALLDRSAVIRLAHLEAALALWRYAENSARFIFGQAMGDPVADDILRALKEAGEAGLTQNQLNELFSGHVKSGVLSQALTALIEAGRVVSQEEPSGARGGRPARRWKILNLTAGKPCSV
jgi:hypothetical protein